ncbi:DUF4876 domain-containing protein [Sphingobacterium hungaricum]|uniref:DUF4876 domain-containing protein n=1 Tax=Sphingobacterium hungaricum TaxID=2082723 RepID=A0A928UT08_9SPHI|nr:DUF4876 domain-containing protein [Sphingobacterium hungaricum]MBE8712786.1 hypothetical protein [Sphingobacterium hungaricum]
MKYQIKIALAVLAIVFLAGCKKEYEEVRPLNVNVQLSVDATDVWFDVPYEKAQIKLVNKANSGVYELNADASGKIVLKDLAPGVYSINVSLEITAEEYTELTGLYREGDFFLNYSLTDKSLFSDENINIELITSEIVGGFVFKQIYYVGSHTRDGALMRDQFVEIYNNSSETLYADSLLFVIAYGKINRNTDAFSLPNNQFDWSQSIGMATTGNANEDYVYAKAIFMVPSDGTGKKYPVEPGKSIVIAQTAVNHAGSYTDNSGNTIGAQKPELTVDLSKADFESWLSPYLQKTQGGNPLASDVDNPGVPNMETYFATSMRDMVLGPQGKDSYVLMKVDQSVNLESLTSYAIPTTRTITSSTTLYPQLSTKYIIDAVEVQDAVPTDRTPRRLPQRFDSGAISVSGGQYSSASVVRKTLKVVAGRRILKDTNNSTNDFGELSKANPYKGDDSFLDN